MRVLNLVVVIIGLCGGLSTSLDQFPVNWEAPNARVWPAIRGNDPVHHNDTLGVWHATDWDFTLSNDTSTEEIAKMIDMAKDRFSAFLEAFIPRSAKEFPVNPTNATLVQKRGASITIMDSSIALLDADESYSIHFGQGSWVQIEAETVYGALHAITTLQQLLQFGWIANDDDPVFVIPLILEPIKDRPFYPYRGLMIDTARHFLPLSLIQLTVEVMAANKLNVLHWHMTDDQSWPYLGERYPELADSAYCKSCVYTVKDIRYIQDVAQSLGIRIIPEFDLPGHSQAMYKSHPDLATVCADGEFGPLDVTREDLYEFSENLFQELFEVFWDPWMHLGGDEVSLDCWNSSTIVREWMEDHNMTMPKELLYYFEYRHVQFVHTYRRPIVWQDVYDEGVRLPRTVVQGIWKDWTFHESLFNATRDGYDVIVSACWYLDHLGMDWWQFYTCNPSDIVNGTEDQLEHVLGGHASMWGEHVDATNFIERVWPRTSAVAEVLWSGSPTFNNSSPLSKPAIRSRLADFRCWLVRLYALPASPIWPGHCGYGPVATAS